MEIRNGRELMNEAYILDPWLNYKVVTYTADHTVTLDQTGHTLVMNHTTNYTFTLPSVGASDVGVEFSFANINTGRLTIDAADSDIIADSGAGHTIYSDTDSYATLHIRLVSTTQWLVIGSHGTWTTTS